MSAALPELADDREQAHARHCPFVPCPVCDCCGGSGILFNNTGPSGLHRQCDECSGSGRQFAEAE